MKEERKEERRKANGQEEYPWNTNNSANAPLKATVQRSIPPSNNCYGAFFHAFQRNFQLAESLHLPRQPVL